MKIKLAPKKTIFLLAVFYSVGVVGFMIPATRELFARLIGFVLLLNMLLLIPFHGRFQSRELTVFILIAAGGYLAEMIGVNTGLLFGDYRYGTALGPGLLNTPLLIGLNWLMLIYCTTAIVQKISALPSVRIVTGALLMVVFDLVLEPSAVRFGMWTWMSGGIPVWNYITWFLLSLGFHGLMEILSIRISNKIAPAVFAIQISFFTIVDLLFLAF